MANMGAIQAALREAGAPKSRLETVGRELRAKGVIPVEGHGPHARAVTAADAARFVVACAGSSKATEAVERLSVLASMRSDRTKLTLHDTLCEQLSGDSVTISELRCSRRSDVAWVYGEGGELETFAHSTYDAHADMVRTEGVFTGPALEQLRALINGPDPARRRAQRRRAKKGAKR
jgi:hypothetical protein